MEEKEKEKLIRHFLRRKDGFAVSSDCKRPDFEIKPKRFLEFAKSDLKQGTKRSIVNALSNVKRAIDSQIDSILIIIGSYKTSKNKKWNFPKKIDYINEYGIISPDILKKINRVRNILEHEYRYPSKEMVKDAIDVTDLFILATKRIIEMGIEIKLDVSSNRLIKLRKNTRSLDMINVIYNNEHHTFVLELEWQSEFYTKGEKLIFKKILSSEMEFTIIENNPYFNQLMKKCIKYIVT